MKIVFYHDKRSVNDATMYYLSLIEKAFVSLGGENIHYCTKLPRLAREVIILTITERYFLRAKFRNPFNKTIFWDQGVAPEEYVMGGGGTLIKYWLKNLLEYIAIKSSNLLFVISANMLDHLKGKYKYPGKNYIIMPCYNLNYEAGLSLRTKERYLNPRFVYAGNVAKWQCITEILQIFRYIEKHLPNATLTILTKDEEQICPLIRKYEIKNIEIKYIKLELLQAELQKYKYGFLIRQDSIVNNVATPTKMNSYLASSVIPIYTNALYSFARHIRLEDYNLCLDAKSSVIEMAKTILDFEQNVLIDPAKFDKLLIDIFDKYYNDELYLNQIENKLTPFFDQTPKKKATTIS